jgi:hypothetical protein
MPAWRPSAPIRTEAMRLASVVRDDTLTSALPHAGGFICFADFIGWLADRQIA